MRERLEERFRAAIRGVLDEAGDAGPVPEFALVASRDPAHGDFACNAALLLAKRLGRPPRHVAESILARLVAEPGVARRAEVAGPGFVNVWLADERWQDLLRRVLELGRAFGRGGQGAGRGGRANFGSRNRPGPRPVANAGGPLPADGR